ncbi:MAG TPA: EAL domain-containing protein, partial [Pseudomonadales bacterium]|nr:EAL domain-containing protein [Pseudomonadales bacterium]
MAYRDYLTGLTNRASLQQHLNAMIQKSMHMDLRGAMLMIDLDHFKTINDALSHDVGDEVLRHVAQRILDSTGAQGLAARLGGDEFVVVIDPIVTPLSVLQEKALDLANRISKALAKPIEIGEHALNIGASIGIATFPNRGENSLDLLRHADMALYQAKSKGRSNVQFYEAPMQTAAYNRLLIEKGLRKALESDQLSLNYQPQVNAAGDITGAEVLLRWKHPKLGNVPPSSFIPLAEETGLIHNIGNWVLHHVCQQILDWKNAGILLPGHFAINVSPWQFTRADFVSRIYSTFTVYGVSPALITLEITESALIYDIKEAIEKLKSLREIGLSISLDDFGTGYSSLSYLQQLPLDEIKIDQSFVRELSIHEHHPLMESMMAIGRHMHLKVVAEGVENGLQRD